jgi:hypothetical protein
MSSASQQLSQLINGGVIVSPCMAYLLLCVAMFWDLATRFCTCIFSNHFCFSHLRVFVLLLSGLSSIFMPERIDLRKLFAKLDCCMTLCSFLRDQVINCSQRS